MSNPRIVFNGIGLDFPEPLSDRRVSRRRIGDQHVTDGGVSETVVLAQWDEVLIALLNFDDAAFAEKLKAWWEWASEGKTYAFANDADNMKDGSFRLPVSDGAATLWASGTGYQASPLGAAPGHLYLLRSADLTNSEIVGIQMISTTFPPTDENLGIYPIGLGGATIYAYAAGDLIRDVYYWPSVVSLDSEYPVVEHGDGTFSFVHRFRENALP